MLYNGNEERIIIMHKNIYSLFIYESCGKMVIWKRESWSGTAITYTTFQYTYPEPCFFVFIYRSQIRADSHSGGHWPPGWHVCSADYKFQLTDPWGWKLPSLYVFLMPTYSPLPMWFTHAIYMPFSLCFVYLKTHVHIHN